LLELLDDENGNAREAAVYSLMSFGGDIPVKVARLLQDKEDYVRVAAIRLLNEKLDPRTSGDILTALQKDKSGNVRAIAARALGALKDKNALDALMEAVTEDTDNFVREESALSLGKIGDAKAIPALISTLKDEYKDTQLRAASSLKTITGQDFGRDREKWSNWYESQKK
jgi:HEAT repeat protein